MKVLVTGATGFIGGALVKALLRAGHEPICCIHCADAAGLPAEVRHLRVDYMKDLEPAVWMARLQGVDAVVNAVGIIRETPRATFEALHHRAPCALFAACEAAGVARVIQISALGADEGAVSGYHRSKRAADEALKASSVHWTIVQPSVVFGVGGASTGLFLALASLPLVPLVGRGEMRLQPIHVEDLVRLILERLTAPDAPREVVPAVGDSPVTLREMLVQYRGALGLRRTWTVPTPLKLMAVVARLGDRLPRAPLTTETLQMLVRGNTWEDGPNGRLGFAPRPLSAFIPIRERSNWRLSAVWSWMRPLLLAALAFLWILTGAVSWFAARAYGLDLLAGLGMGPGTAQAALAAACLLNVALGVATLLRPRAALFTFQLLVMIFYTAMLTVVAPGLWSDPFGPLAKNLPLAGLLLWLIHTEA